MQTLSNSQADAEWFLMKIREGFTVRELADLPCVWMTGEEIANLVGIEYTPPAYIYPRPKCRLERMQHVLYCFAVHVPKRRPAGLQGSA